MVTSDVTKGNTKLRLFADVYSMDEPVAPVVIEPSVIEIGSDQVAGQYTVVVKSVSDVPLTPKLVAGPESDFIIAFSGKAIKPGATTEITVRLTNDYEPRIIKKSFTFELDDAKRTRFTIPVRTVKPTTNPLQPSSPAARKTGGM